MTALPHGDRDLAHGDHDLGVPPLVTDLAALLRQHGDGAYREFLRGPALSLGLFAADRSYADVQDPHRQDEVYVVLEGSAVIDVDGRTSAVSAGAVVYVPRGVPHRFTDVSDGLRVLVVFAPAPD